MEDGSNALTSERKHLRHVWKAVRRHELAGEPWQERLRQPWRLTRLRSLGLARDQQAQRPRIRETALDRPSCGCLRVLQIMLRYEGKGGLTGTTRVYRLSRPKVCSYA